MSAAAPFFSIAMPTYNCAGYVEEAIESVLGQDFGDFELLIGDDGSADGTVEILQRFAARDPRVRLIPRTAGGVRGPGANRNRLLAQARGPWFKFLDGDDIWPLDHLRRCHDAIARCPGAVIYFGDYRRFQRSVADAEALGVEGKGFFDPRADYVAEVAQDVRGLELFRLRPDRLLRFCCLFYCPIATQSVTLHAATVRANAIAFHEDWFINEDFHVWMRMLECGSAVALHRLLFYYRYNPKSLTSNVMRYYEGMARSHGAWMRRTWDRLDAADRRRYRDKVGGFLQAAGWERSRRGQVLKATWAEMRAAWVLRRPLHLLAVLRTAARAMVCRLRGDVGRPAA